MRVILLNGHGRTRRVGSLSLFISAIGFRKLHGNLGYMSRILGISVQAMLLLLLRRDGDGYVTLRLFGRKQLTGGVYWMLLLLRMVAIVTAHVTRYAERSTAVRVRA